MEDATNPLGEVEAVDAIANLLGGQDDPVPEEPEEDADEPQEEATDEGDESSEDEEQEATAETPEELEEITWEGETKKLTKTEVRELAQKGFDYTQKTQQLAEARRHFEAEAQAVKQSIALQNQQIEVIAEVKSLDSQLAQFKDVNWHQLAESDPVQYLKLNQTYRDLKETREAKVQDFHGKAQQLQQSQAQAQAAYVAEQQKLMLEAIPEFKGPKANEARTKVAEYLRTAGFSAQEVSNVMDARMVKVAYEAAQWRALQASKPALTKRVAETPKVVKAGTPKTQAPQASKDAYASLRKTGRGEYAAKLIENML
jgi:hypothetical protein